MKLETLNAYPPRIVRVLAAFAQMRQRAKPGQTVVATYAGLATLLQDSEMATKLNVLKASKLGLLERANPEQERGRGVKAMWKLTKLGADAL